MIRMHPSSFFGVIPDKYFSLDNGAQSKHVIINRLVGLDNYHQGNERLYRDNKRTFLKINFPLFQRKTNLDAAILPED